MYFEPPVLLTTGGKNALAIIIFTPYRKWAVINLDNTDEPV